MTGKYELNDQARAFHRCIQWHWLGVAAAQITWPFPTWRVRYRPFDHERDA